MDHHDDDFYTHNPGNMLLMWPDVGANANIWSPEAKKLFSNVLILGRTLSYFLASLFAVISVLSN